MALNIGRILKALQLPDQVGESVKMNLNNVLQKKPYLSEYISRIDGAIEDPQLSETYKHTFPKVLEGDEDVIRDTYSQLDSALKSNDFADQLDVTGLSDKQFFNNAKTFVKQSLRHFEHSYRQSYRAYEANIGNLLKKEGLEVYEAAKMLIEKPAKFQRIYGVDQDQLAAALYDNTRTGLEPVDKILDILQKTDQDLIKQFQDAGTFIGFQGNYFLPFQIQPETVSGLGADRVIDLLTKHTGMTLEGATKLTAKLADPENFLANKLPKAEFKESILKFNSGADMVQFYKAISSNDFGLNLFNEYFLHKQRIVRAAHLSQILGANPVETLAKAVAKSRLKLGTTLDRNLDKSYRDLYQHIDRTMRILNGQKFAGNDWAIAIGSTVNQLMSLATKAPARSAVRNLFIDFEGHAVAIGKGLHNDGFSVGGSAGRIFRTLHYLVTQTADNRESQRAVNEILNIAGWANSLDGLAHANVLSFEDILETSTLGQRSLGVLQQANEKLARAQDFLYKWSGNHSLIDFVRARRFISIQQLYSSMLDHTTYKGLRESLPDIELKQLDYMADNYGFDETMFNFLKQAKRVESVGAHKVFKDLDYKRIPKFISKESILDTSDEVANQFKRSNETARQFKERMANNWQRFVYNSTTRYAPVPTVTDSIVPQIVDAIGPTLAIPIRPFLKFGDVAHAQWLNLKEEIGAAIYGRPQNFIGMDRSLLKWGSAALGYTAYAAAATWTKDVLNNRAPTDFRDLDNAKKLVAISGFGGVYNMAAANLAGVFPTYGGSLYSQTPLGSLFKSGKGIYKATQQPDNVLGHTAGALHRANPFTQLWYASGAVEYLLNHTLLTPSGKSRRYNNLESYGKPYLY